YLETTIKESGAAVKYESLPVVQGEPYPLTLLFQNLISNGIKYRRPDQPPRLRVSAVRNDSMWTFAVEDNGIGVEEKYREAVFAPFKRLHGKNYPGTGLGLAMCKKIVERHGGKIWIESSDGQGSTFRFTLPVDGH